MPGPSGPVPGSSPLTAARYVHQRPEELVYRLLAGMAPRAVVRVLSERTIALPWGEATLAIIGSSHFLELTAGDSAFTEMLSSSGPDSEALPLLARIEGPRGRHFRRVDGRITYRFEMRRKDLDAAEFRAETERLTHEDPDRISFRFPAEGDEPGGVTCLEWRVDAGTLRVETHHTFPGELAVVRSRTAIGFPERGVAP